MFLLYCVFLFHIVFSNILIDVQANDSFCDIKLIAAGTYLTASISNIDEQPTFQWSCMENIHSRDYPETACCRNTEDTMSFPRTWMSTCIAKTDPLYLTYTRRQYFRVEITDGECQNTTELLKVIFTVPDNNWMLERSDIQSPLEYTCSTNYKHMPYILTWRLLTEGDSDIYIYTMTVNHGTCNTNGDVIFFEKVKCLQPKQVSVRVNYSMILNYKDVYMTCECKSQHRVSFNEGSNVMDLNQIDLQIQGLNNSQTVIGWQPLRLTTIQNGRIQNPTFHWALVHIESHDAIFQPCYNLQTTTNIPGWSYLSTCDLRFIDDVRSFSKPFVMNVTVVDDKGSVTSKISKNSIIFSAPWTLHVVYNELTTISCSFNQSGYAITMVIFKFITSDFEFDVILNIDDCTFSYNPLIKSVECRIERGKAEIQVFLWKEWKYIVDMYSRCHAVNDVTQGAAYLLLNKTGADRNRVWDFRGIHILGITHTETDKDRDPLRLTVILNARVIHPNFFWSLIDKELHEVLLKPCSSQRFNTTIQGWSYTSTCYLNFTDDFTFLTRAKFVRVTVFDNDTSIIASTTSKSIHKFLAPWTIYAEYQPNTTVTCSFNESNQQNMKIQLTFMTSKWKYHVVISTDLCTLDPTPFIKDIQCYTDGGIFNIFVDLWEDLKYRDDIYVRCHDASDVIRGSIYIPIHDKHLRDEERHRFFGVTNDVSESIVVITFTICVLATIVDTLIMAKILLEKCEGRLSKHHEEEDVYSTITSCRQSSDSLQVHEHILPHLAIGHQNMES